MHRGSLAVQRYLPSPQLPSQSVIDDQWITLISHCSWCRECVEGRGREMAHGGVDHGGRSIGTIAFDWLFATKKGVQRSGTTMVCGKSLRSARKVLGVRGLKSEAVFADAVVA